MVLIALALAGTVAWMSRGLPDPNHLISREVPENTKIFDRTGETVLYNTATRGVKANGGPGGQQVKIVIDVPSAQAEANGKP